MDKKTLNINLARAEHELVLYINARKENVHINRLKKALRHPFKVARVTAYRKNILSSADQSMTLFSGAHLTLPLWDEDACITYYTRSFGYAELLLVKYLINTLQTGSVFYDVGANLGLYTALAESLGGQVHSFEPNPATISYLERNALPSTTVNHVALSAEPGEIDFYILPESRKKITKVGMGGSDPEVTGHSNKLGLTKIQIPAQTLDEYVLSHSVPDILKIDVVSFENAVVKGGEELFSRHSPVLAVRVYNTPTAIVRTKETLIFLKDKGYAAFAINTDGTIAATEIIPETLSFATTFIFKK